MNKINHKINYLLQPIKATSKLPKKRLLINKNLTEEVLVCINDNYSKGCHSIITNQWLVIPSIEGQTLFENKDVIWFKKIKLKK